MDGEKEIRKIYFLHQELKEIYNIINIQLVMPVPSENSYKIKLKTEARDEKEEKEKRDKPEGEKHRLTLPNPVSSS